MLLGARTLPRAGGDVEQSTAPDILKDSRRFRGRGAATVVPGGVRLASILPTGSSGSVIQGHASTALAAVIYFRAFVAAFVAALGIHKMRRTKRCAAVTGVTVSFVAAFVAEFEYGMESTTPLCKNRVEGLCQSPCTLFLHRGDVLSIPFRTRV